MFNKVVLNLLCAFLIFSGSKRWTSLVRGLTGVCAREHRRSEAGGVQLSLLGGTGNTRTGQSFFPLCSRRFSECSHPVWRTCCVNFIKSNKIVQLFKLYLHMNIQRITSRSTSPDTKFTHSQPIRVQETREAADDIITGGTKRANRMHCTEPRVCRTRYCTWMKVKPPVAMTPSLWFLNAAPKSRRTSSTGASV